MSASSQNIGLVIALGLSLSANWLVTRDVSQPNSASVLPNMAYAVSAESYASSDVLPNGQVLQPPPAGTLAWGAEVFPYGPTAEEGDRAGRELRNPLDPQDPAVLARGKWVFENYCAHCHGLGGTGDGVIVQRGYPAPKSLVAGELALVPDGRMFHSLTQGRKNMPPHAYQVDVDDRWRVIAYVRSLQAAAAAAPAPGGQP